MPSRSPMERLLDYDGDFIRAIACICLTDMVDECSRLGSKVVHGSSVVWCRSNEVTISHYIHRASIKPAPFQLHSMAGPLGFNTLLKRNVSRSPASLSIDEVILLRR